MGPNHHYIGVKPILELFKNNNATFAYISEESSETFLKDMNKVIGDIDLLGKSLGT